MPVVSMGTNNTSSHSFIRTALEKGIRLLVTAGAYQNGNNERIIGEAIKDMPSVMQQTQDLVLLQ